MPVNVEDEEILLRCACGDRMEHVAWLIYDPIYSGPRPTNLKGVDDDWYLFTGLDPNFGFWRRVWTALRYVFKPLKLRYYGYSELVLRNEDVDKLREFIGRHRDAAIANQ